MRSFGRRVLITGLAGLALLFTIEATSGLSFDRLPAEIEDPTGRAMLSFYESLAATDRGDWATRILHYGDSHVAADILTGALRQRLQSVFGDAGPGFVLAGQPWSWYSRPGVISRASSGWRVGGLSQTSAFNDDRLGLGGIRLDASRSGEWLTVTASARFFELYVLKQRAGGAIDVLLDAVKTETNLSLKAESTYADYVEIVAVDDSLHSIEIRTLDSGVVCIFGIAIENDRAGVVYDALGINGARAGRPLSWNWDIVSNNLERRDPDLIVVAYGSNEVTDADLDLEEYSGRFKELLARFHQAAPRASVLVISPPDRAVRVGRKWKTVATMSALIDAQRRAARQSGAAFFDLFKAMGGAGSIDRWATAGPPLAQPDHVHLTSAGYKLVAEWIDAELMRGYTKNSSTRGPKDKK